MLGFMAAALVPEAPGGCARATPLGDAQRITHGTGTGSTTVAGAWASWVVLCVCLLCLKGTRLDCRRSEGFVNSGKHRVTGM
jgi:hypothetical protein